MLVEQLVDKSVALTGLSKETKAAKKVVWKVSAMVVMPVGKTAFGAVAR